MLGAELQMSNSHYWLRLFNLCYFEATWKEKKLCLNSLRGSFNTKNNMFCKTKTAYCRVNNCGISLLNLPTKTSVIFVVWNYNVFLDWLSMESYKCPNYLLRTCLSPLGKNMLKNPTHSLKIHPFSIIKMNTGSQKNRNKKNKQNPPSC